MSSHPCQATRLRLHIGSRLYICPQESQKKKKRELRRELFQYCRVLLSKYWVTVSVFVIFTAP